MATSACMRASSKKRATSPARRSSKAALPRTEYRLTGTGRIALDSYLTHMEALIRAMRQGVKIFCLYTL